MRKKICGLFAFLLLCSQIWGCGDTKQDMEEPKSKAPQEQESGWFPVEYRDQITPAFDMEQEKYDCMSRFYAGHGKDAYILSNYWVYENYDYENPMALLDYTDRKYSLTHMDGNELETSTVLCQYSYVEEGPLKGAFVCAMDCVEQKVLLFLESFDPKDSSLTHCYVVSVDENGQMTILSDIKEALEEAGFLTKPDVLLTNFHFDAAGNFYLLSEDEKQLCMIDAEGTLCTVLPMEARTENSKELLSLEYGYKSKEGSCVWKGCGKQTQQTVFFTLEQGQWKEQCGIPVNNVELPVCSASGDFYGICDSNRICRFSSDKEEGETLYQTSTDVLKATQLILSNEQGELVLLGEDDYQNSYATRYAPSVGKKEEVTLTLYSYDFCQPGTQLDRIVKRFEKMHPGVHIETVYAEGTKEERERALVELVSDLAKGEGPDLFYLPKADLRNLANKAVLMELDDILLPEIREQIYPVVLEYGTVGDSLYGLTFTGSLETVLISESRWSKDQWTWEDAKRILREKEETGNPYIGISNDRYSTDGLTAEDMLRFFFQGICESSLVDVEKGSCQFNVDIFRDILMLCKQYGKPTPQVLSLDEETRRGQYQAVLNQELFSYTLDFFDSRFVEFSEAMAEMEPCHAIGFPSEQGSYHYFAGDYLMAVNKNSQDSPWIAEFLNDLYSYEVQYLAARVPVRKDYLQDCVRGSVGWSQSSFVHVPGQRGWEKIATRPDGTTYYQEYHELMEDCIVKSELVDEILNIVLEEASGYFQGDKDIDTVVSNVQSILSISLAE